MAGLDYGLERRGLAIAILGTKKQTFSLTKLPQTGLLIRSDSADACRKRNVNNAAVATKKATQPILSAMEHSSPPQRAASINDRINDPASNPAPSLGSNPDPDPDPNPTPNPTATSNPKSPSSPKTTTPNPTATPNPAPNMALATLPSYFNYNLNILCGPYANPFFVHIFLGDIPHLIDYQDPYSIPSWVGQDAIYPNPVQPPPQIAVAAPPPPGSTHATPSPHTHELSDNSAPGPVPERRPSPPPIARPLPPSYTKGAVRSSQPLTTAIVARLHARSAAELSPTTVARYLQLNLQWRLVGIGIPDRKRISVQQVPIRLWVVRQNVTPPADDTQFPVYGPAEVVWEASRGKLGGLERGELPGVG